jgi:hypothetical protein
VLRLYNLLGRPVPRAGETALTPRRHRPTLPRAAGLTPEEVVADAGLPAAAPAGEAAAAPPDDAFAALRNGRFAPGDREAYR